MSPRPDSAEAPLVPGLPLLGSALAAATDTARFFARCHQGSLHYPKTRVTAGVTRRAAPEARG